MKVALKLISGHPISPRETEQQWKADATRRRDEVRSGKVKTISAAKVYRCIERLLGK